MFRCPDIRDLANLGGTAPPMVSKLLETGVNKLPEREFFEGKAVSPEPIHQSAPL